MARKQNAYLSTLLADEPEATTTGAAPPSPVSAERGRGMTLLGRESALARAASGEVRQVTQLLLNPARCRIWKGNARVYRNLSEERCRELIDSILAEGGQKVPAVVRRVEGDTDHDYEVIAGTRRHWSISWLRANSYPDMAFLAQVQVLDDESAFRLADLENRARKDVSDLERARNYASALADHYGGHQTRMADRLKVSKGWLSKMLKVAQIPDAVMAAFASPDDLLLGPAYPLAKALDDPAAARSIIETAGTIAEEQSQRLRDGHPPCSASDVLRRLLTRSDVVSKDRDTFIVHGKLGRPALSILSANRQGVTLRLHAGSGSSESEILEAVSSALSHLKAFAKAPVL